MVLTYWRFGKLKKRAGGKRFYITRESHISTKSSGPELAFTSLEGFLIQPRNHGLLRTCTVLLPRSPRRKKLMMPSNIGKGKTSEI